METVKIGRILMDEGWINERALDFCLSVQRSGGHERLGKVLKDYDFINDDQMTEALAKQSGWRVYQGAMEPDRDMARVLGVDFMRRHAVFPVLDAAGTIGVMAGCHDIQAMDTVQKKGGPKVRFMIATETRIRKAIDAIDKELKDDDGFAAVSPEDLPHWFAACLKDAISDGATDIHLEPSSRALEVRFRLDGILHFYQALPLSFQKRIVNIVFHKADVTISDFGRFHDARFTHRDEGAHVEVRVSHVPSVHGSSLVLRLLDRNRSAIGLTSLGYAPELWEQIEAMLVKPEGMVLIAGPTGCGKTTTLYAMLNAVKSIERKIMTIEDPVEVFHSLLTQVQANEKRDIAFSNSVRAFLRHDPNMMLIGEVRDEMTAREAVRASMTGHKVFATIHAAGCMDVFLRLHDLNVPFAYMASNISMVITQRLVRLLCPHCRIECRNTDEVLTRHESKYVGTEGIYYQPSGCRLCRGGYQGRSVVAGILDCDSSVAGLLLDGDIAGLGEYLRAKEGLCSMAAQAKTMVRQGRTSPQEAVRVLG